MKLLYLALVAVIFMVVFSRCGKKPEVPSVAVQTRSAKPGPISPQPVVPGRASFEAIPWAPASAPTPPVDRPRETNLPPPPIPPVEGPQEPDTNSKLRGT
jgi:hypothetical protein